MSQIIISTNWSNVTEVKALIYSCCMCFHSLSTVHKGTSSSSALLLVLVIFDLQILARGLST